MHEQKPEASAAPKESSFQLTLPIAIVFAALVISGSILITNRAPADEAAAAAGNANIVVRAASAQDHIIGSPDATVVLIEYADLECPFCTVIHPRLEQIVAESGGKVAWVFRHFPLESIHSEARPAAIASECVAELAGNDAFWKFVDGLYANQKTLGVTLYASLAKELGADPAAFSSCVTSGRYDEKIDNDGAEALANGGNGTPYTVIMGKKGNPVPLSGALPMEQLKAVIRAVLSRQ